MEKILDFNCIYRHFSSNCTHIQQGFVPSSGPFSWLDGSHITYSNWVSSPRPEAACGHILRNSGFRWETTRDCNQKLHFICQFGMYADSNFRKKNTKLNHFLIYHFIVFIFFTESGRSIVCAGHNATLQCGSGQVLMIDGGVYGRNNFHYCRSTASPPTTPTHQCSWVDVLESLTGKNMVK